MNATPEEIMNSALVTTTSIIEQLAAKDCSADAKLIAASNMAMCLFALEVETASLNDPDDEDEAPDDIFGGA